MIALQVFAIKVLRSLICSVLNHCSGTVAAKEGNVALRAHSERILECAEAY